jgi:O-acetyl-ADP-ribose deacetylase (regulator of RNase III)
MRYNVPERLDYSFQVVETMIRVVYTDITRLEVDAIVSTDDVHLSRVEPNGVAAAIRAAAGDLPRDDARKHALPAPLGSVLVTSAGRLGAKYILHAMTFEYSSRLDVESLIPQVVRRVLELATALRIERLALPVLISGRAGAPKAEVITRMARSLACGLVTVPHRLREVTIAIYKGGTPDHAEMERKRIEELTPVREQVAAWAAESAPVNTRLALLLQLYTAAASDRELHELLGSRIAADRQALCRLFGCPDEEAGVVQPDAERSNSGPRNRQEYDFAQRQLTTLLADLEEETNHLSELKRAEKRRLHSLERQRAQQGADTGPAVVTEIEDITRTLDQRDRQIQQLKEQHAAARHDLDLLQRGRQQQP